MIIIFDTETTGLLLPEGAPLENQPKIIELAAIKIDEDGNEVDRLEMLINPIIPLPAIITKITGIKDEDLVSKPTFDFYVGELIEFFTGVHTVIAHNVSFDMGMLINDLKRATALDQFPLPQRRICTVEATHHLFNKRLNLTKAYRHYTGKDPAETHRAMGDVLTLKELVGHLVEKGIICLSISSSEVKEVSNDVSGQSQP